MTTTSDRRLPPKDIQIGPYHFTTVLDKAEWDKAVKDHGDADLFGLMVDANQQILADPDQADDMLADTILHEVLHAIFMTAGSRERKKFSEEQMICLISPMLLDTLRRNPDLVTFLLGDREAESSVQNP